MVLLLPMIFLLFPVILLLLPVLLLLLPIILIAGPVVVVLSMFLPVVFAAKVLLFALIGRMVKVIMVVMVVMVTMSTTVTTMTAMHSIIVMKVITTVMVLHHAHIRLDSGGCWVGIANNIAGYHAILKSPVITIASSSLGNGDEDQKTNEDSALPMAAVRATWNFFAANIVLAGVPFFDNEGFVRWVLAWLHFEV